MNTMLTALNLGNFKAFAETQNIPIRPLTLIFGANSAGKSSILHGLLFAREAMESGNLNVTKPGLAGDSVDLGGFGQFVHRHKPQTSFTWGAEFRLPEDVGIFSLATPKATDIGLTVQIADSPAFGVMAHQLDVSVMGRPLLELSFRSPVVSTDSKSFSQRGARQVASNTLWKNASRYLIQRLDLEHPLMQFHFVPVIEKLLGRKLGVAERKKIGKFVDDLTSEITALVENFIPKEAELVHPKEFCPESFRQAYPQLIKWMENGKSWDDLPKLKFSSPGQLSKSHLEGIVGVVLFATLDELLRKTHALMVQALDSLTYLGPLRFYPERHYSFSEKRGDPYSRGEHNWDVLCNNSDVRDRANEWLKRMKIHYEIKPRVWRTTGEQKRELALVDTRNGTAVSHRDIGVGVSQMLPIIATACGSQNQIHTIEQPEIHVHPALQAELGDLFIESALGEKKNTFILETHSEHLLLRIMRRMRETSAGKLPKGVLPVRPSDVAVLYVQHDGARSVVREMPLNQRGELIKAWPGGFFEEGLREVFT